MEDGKNDQNHADRELADVMKQILLNGEGVIEDALELKVLKKRARKIRTDKEKMENIVKAECARRICESPYDKSARDALGAS